MTSDSQLGAGARTNLKELWRAALGELQLAMPKANYDTWFKETYVVSEEDDVFCIGVPNAFAREWLEEAYTDGEGWSKERLYKPDMCLVEWRKLASRHNRGIQRKPRPLDTSPAAK